MGEDRGQFLLMFYIHIWIPHEMHILSIHTWGKNGIVSWVQMWSRPSKRFGLSSKLGGHWG